MADPMKMAVSHDQGDQPLGEADYQTILDLLKARDPRGLKLAQSLKGDEVQTFFDFQKQSVKGVDPSRSPDRNLMTGVPLLGSIDPADVTLVGGALKSGARVAGGALHGMANGLEEGFSRGMAGGLKGLLNELGFGAGASKAAGLGIEEATKAIPQHEPSFNASSPKTFGKPPNLEMSQPLVGAKMRGAPASGIPDEVAEQVGRGVQNDFKGQVSIRKPAEIPVVNRDYTAGDYAADNAYMRARGQEPPASLRKLAGEGTANDTGFRGGMHPNQVKSANEQEWLSSVTGEPNPNPSGKGTYKEGGSGNLGGPDTAGLRKQPNVSLKRTAADVKEQVTGSSRKGYSDPRSIDLDYSDTSPENVRSIEAIQAELAKLLGKRP